jgi:hypothetical protein
LDDSAQLNRHEGIGPDIVGMAVDYYLTRFKNGSDVKEAFSILIRGA